MTPAARVQAAIEILDQVIVAARDNGAAADTIVARYFRDRRYAGSKDRRVVRDLVYAAIRRAGERPSSGRAAMIGLADDRPDIVPLFSGEGHGPRPMGDGEERAPAGIVPQWLSAHLGHLGEADMVALGERAPLDIRVNRLKAMRADAAIAFPDSVPLASVEDGLRLAGPVLVEQHPLYLAGAVEVQDEGSQLVAAACTAKGGELVVDLCAGAGGKALALAAMMGNRGRIIASDTDRSRLSRLQPRSARAGASIIEPRLLDPGREGERLADVMAAADIVLVDAPCSGTGTWRRNPEARWRLTPAQLTRLAALQARLLGVGAQLVRPGGRLVYAVCSLLREEGEMQIEAFLEAQPDWTADALPFAMGLPAGPGRRLTPAHDGTDGFFVASLVCPC